MCISRGSRGSFLFFAVRALAFGLAGEPSVSSLVFPFRLIQVILDPRVWRKDEGSDAAPRRREPVQCIKRDIVEALLQVY